MMLLKWTLSQVRTGMYWVFARCCCILPCGSCRSCKEGCEKKIHHDPVLQAQLGPLQEELEQQLVPRSQGRSSSKESTDWNLSRAFGYLGVKEEDIQVIAKDRDRDRFKMATEVADYNESLDCISCRARSEVTMGCAIWATPLCQKCIKRRCEDVMATLKLTDLDEFAKSVVGGESEENNSSCLQRSCTNKGRQARALSAGTPRGDGIHRKHDIQEKSLNELINTWRLMLATYQHWCKETIDAKYRILTKQLQRDESHKQCSSSNAKTEISAEVVARIINNLSEFKADQKYSTQRAVMVVGALSCAVAPWIYTYLLGCHDDRICGAYVPADLLNSTLSLNASGTSFSHNSSTATVWTECGWLLPPCEDLITGERAYLNGSTCQLQPQQSGFDQPHECPDGEDPHYQAKLIIASFI